MLGWWALYAKQLGSTATPTFTTVLWHAPCGDAFPCLLLQRRAVLLASSKKHPRQHRPFWECAAHRHLALWGEFGPSVWKRQGGPAQRSVNETQSQGCCFVSQSVKSVGADVWPGHR